MAGHRQERVREAMRRLLQGQTPDGLVGVWDRLYGVSARTCRRDLAAARQELAAGGIELLPDDVVTALRCARAEALQARAMQSEDWVTALGALRLSVELHDRLAAARSYRSR
jgi:hypothetical protein